MRTIKDNPGEMVGQRVHVTYYPLHLGLACAVSGIVAGAQETFAGEMNETSLSG